MLDPDERFSIELFLSMTTASEETYRRVKETVERRHPNDKILSFYQVKRLLAEFSGVQPILRDACPDSCMAYTGPYASLDRCLHCKKSRYKPGTVDPCRQFQSFPLGPQMQALWRLPKTALKMKYRNKHTARVLYNLEGNAERSLPYTDFFDGDAYLDAVRAGTIKPEDTVIMLSLDGAQLYRNKTSDCWIYIWIIMDLSPELRYKKRHIIPGE